MHIKFDSLKTGLKEVVEYQKSMTVAKGIMFDLFIKSHRFLEWIILVDFPVEKDFNNFEISLVENENALVYFLIKVDMKADELKVEVKHVYDDAKYAQLFSSLNKNNVFRLDTWKYVQYIEDTFKSLNCFKHSDEKGFGFYKMNNNAAANVEVN